MYRELAVTPVTDGVHLVYIIVGHLGLMAETATRTRVFFFKTFFFQDNFKLRASVVVSTCLATE